MSRVAVGALVFAITAIGSGWTARCASAQPVTSPTLPPGESAPPGPVAAPPSPSEPVQELDARSLANRALSRELDGDRPGAIADLSAAIAKESDPARRASMENLLQLLQSPR